MTIGSQQGKIGAADGMKMTAVIEEIDTQGSEVETAETGLGTDTTIPGEKGAGTVHGPGTAVGSGDITETRIEVEVVIGAEAAGINTDIGRAEVQGKVATGEQEMIEAEAKTAHIAKSENVQDVIHTEVVAVSALEVGIL